MNSLGITAVWGIAQVSAVALLAIACYALARRRGPAARSHVAATSLGVTLLVAALAISPWPRWFSVAPQAQPAAVAVAPTGDVAGRSPAAPNGTAAEADTEIAPGLAKQSPSTIDVAATFWQTLLRELATAPAADAGAWSFSWPAAVALLLGVALALGALRLAAGLWSVRELRTTSRPIADRRLLAEVDRLRDVMGCERSIEIRSSSRLASPVTVGWRRALILLPADWDDWNEAELRTALAHELAHIVRGDYAAGVLAQFCVAANFYHPLVHWLARRLRLEQELAADAVAATVIGSRGEYLMTLAQLALRCDDRPVAWAARPFLPGRGALSRRIDMLRDARQVLTRPLSRASRGAIVAALVCVGLFAAGVRGPDDRSGAATAAEPPGQGTRTAADVTSKKAPFDLSQIPREAQVVAAVRPADVFRQKALAPIADMINKLGGFEQSFGAPIEQVEEFVIAGMIDTEKMDPPPRNPGGGTVRIMMRMKAPIDLSKFQLLAQTGDHPAAEEVAGKKFYPAAQPDALAYFLLNDSTVVLGGSDDLRAWLKSGAKKNWAPAGWDTIAQSDAALWTDVKSLRSVMASVSQTPAAAMAASFSVLWEETDTLMVGASVGTLLSVRATAKCTSPENAERVQKTLEALITLATNSADAIKNQPGPGLGGPEAGLINSGLNLLGLIKLSRDEATVQARVDAPLESVTVFAAIAPAVGSAREAARRAASANNMKQLGIAMHTYADTHKHFPPAVLLGPDGKTPHSWRVALLPYLDQMELYKQYKLDEPWDSENNKQVLAKMPALFRAPSDAPNSLNAGYFALVGPQTLFHDNKGTSLRQITDGTSNTIMFVDAKRDIPWTKPEDIEVPADKPLPKFGGWFPDVFLAAFADGSVRVILDTVKEDTIRALLTRSGKEAVQAP